MNQSLSSFSNQTVVIVEWTRTKRSGDVISFPGAVIDRSGANDNSSKSSHNHM